MHPKVLLATLSLAAFGAATVPAAADVLGPDFDWRDTVFSTSGQYGQNPTRPNGQTSNNSSSSAGNPDQSTSFTSSPGISGESRYIHDMSVGDVSTTVTIESVNPQCTNYGSSTCRNKWGVMTWSADDGIGVTQKNPDYTDYEVDEIEGKNEVLRFSFSDPIEISAIYVTDLFANERFDNSNERYDEWGFFRLNTTGAADQDKDGNTFQFTADGDGTGTLEQYNAAGTSKSVVGSIEAIDMGNGEWKIVLPTPVLVSSIDFWAEGQFYSNNSLYSYYHWCKTYTKLYGDSEFSLAGIDVVQPTQNVPEPGPMGLVLAGLLGLGAARYRNRRG